MDGWIIGISKQKKTPHEQLAIRLKSVYTTGTVIRLSTAERAWSSRLSLFTFQIGISVIPVVLK